MEKLNFSSSESQKKKKTSFLEKSFFSKFSQKNKLMKNQVSKKKNFPD